MVASSDVSVTSFYFLLCSLNSCHPGLLKILQMCQEGSCLWTPALHVVFSPDVHLQTPSAPSVCHWNITSWRGFSNRSNSNHTGHFLQSLPTLYSLVYVFLFVCFLTYYDFLIMFNAYCISVTSGKNLYLVHGHVLTVQKKYWAQVKCPHDEWFIWQESMVLPLYEWHLNNWVSVPRCPLLRDYLCERWWCSPFCFRFHNWSFPFRHILPL